MQSSPPNRVSVRPRSLTFVLAGAVLLLVGDALGYTWTLYFAINYPYYYLSGLEWSTLASIASFIGMVVYAIGFFLMLYGIALRIRLGQPSLVPAFTRRTVLLTAHRPALLAVATRRGSEVISAPAPTASKNVANIPGSAVYRFMRLSSLEPWLDPVLQHKQTCCQPHKRLTPASIAFSLAPCMPSFLSIRISCI